MGKFSDYLDDIKNQTDGLRTIVSDKSGVDCANLSIEGVAEVVKNISFGKEPVLQEKFVDPDVVTKIVEADTGYDGLSKVHFTAVTSAIDTNIVADNIKKDVTILGVTGTLESAVAEDLTEELTAQDTALTSLESAVDKLPEPKPDRLQWKCDNIKRLDYEFQYYQGESLDDICAGLDTSKVTSVYYLFASCNKLKSLPKLNTINIKDMRGIASSCSALVTVSLLDMISVTQTSLMFSGCKNLTNLTLKNIKVSLEIGSGTSYGHLLTLDSLVNTIKELWDYSSGTSTKKLTMGTVNLEKIANTYVKLITPTAEQIAEDEYLTSKMPCEVCNSTDEGAMTITEYALLKKWELA